jgi:alpha-glucosidase
LYIKNGDEDYVGTEWPGFSVWPDFTEDPHVQQYWTDEFKRYFEQLEYDGWWLDISDAPSWYVNEVHNPISWPRHASVLASQR